MNDERIELLQGTLDMLVLKSLVDEAKHGFSIMARIRQLSQEALTVEEGSLYPALRRLGPKKLIASRAGLSENNRKARFYRLTAKGRKQLDVETANWVRLTSAINLVMGTT